MRVRPVRIPRDVICGSVGSAPPRFLRAGPGAVRQFEIYRVEPVLFMAELAVHLHEAVFVQDRLELFPGKRAHRLARTLSRARTAEGQAVGRLQANLLLVEQTVQKRFGVGRAQLFGAHGVGGRVTRLKSSSRCFSDSIFSVSSAGRAWTSSPATRSPAAEIQSRVGICSDWAK